MGALSMRDVIERDAWITPDGVHRYVLTRIWQPGVARVVWIGLNPSTADAEKDDMTIVKMMVFAANWGFGGIDVVNLFALRATDPSEVRHAENQAHAVGPRNDETILRAISQPAVGKIVLGWGDPQGIPQLWGRKLVVLRAIRDQGKETYCLGLTATGEPRHPSRLAYSTRLHRVAWDPVIGMRLVT